MEPDYITIIAVTLAAAGFVAMAWIGGYELGQSHGADHERTMTKPRIDGLLAELNALKPRGKAPKWRTRK
jgi:hypothetical protein